MAREYARRAGETEAVAQALYDMELPRSAGDPVPSTTPGALLALADRFDLLVGLFGIGAKPTGSSDPFALRRAAGGVVAILREHPALRSITLPAGLQAAAAEIGAQGIDVPAESLDEVAEFTVRRYEQQLIDRGDDHLQVAAVLPLADGSGARRRNPGEPAEAGRQHRLRRAGRRTAARPPHRPRGTPRRRTTPASSPSPPR